MVNSKECRKRKANSECESEELSIPKRTQVSSNNCYTKVVRYKPLDKLDKQLQCFVDERLSLQLELQRTLRHMISTDKDIMHLKEEMEKELTNQMCDDKKETVGSEIRKLTKQKHLLEESSKANKNKILQKKKQLSSCKMGYKNVESDDSSYDSDEDEECFCLC